VTKKTATKDTAGTMTRAAWLASALIAVGLVGLTGCAPGNSYPRISEVLATPSEAEDALPGSTAEWGMNPESSRLVGSVDNMDYFVATSTDPDTGETNGCLIMVNTEDEAAAASSCSPGEAGMYLYGMDIGAARISGDTATYPESAGWVQVGGFLLVKPNASATD